MMRRSWYDRGWDDAGDGVCDPPFEKGNRHHDSYLEGFEDRQKAFDREADYDRANDRPRRM